MTILVFDTYVKLDQNTKWTESSNCPITNLLDEFRNQEEECIYMHAICPDSGIIIALPVSHICDGETELFFVNMVEKDCKRIQNHRFRTFIQTIE